MKRVKKQKTETTTDQKLTAILQRVEGKIDTRSAFEFGMFPKTALDEWDEKKQKYKDSKVQASWLGWKCALKYIADVCRR